MRAMATMRTSIRWAKPVNVVGPVIAAPILVGSTLYGGTENGLLWGIDLADGALGWQLPMHGGGAIARQPLFANGTLVFTSRQREARGPDGVMQQFRGATVTLGPGWTGPIRVGQATAPVVLDGAISDAGWQQAPRLPTAAP